MCNADGTVEHPRVTSQGSEVIDGMGERKCKDWTQLWDLAEEPGQGT